MHVLIALIVGVLLLIVAQAQRAPEWEYCDETNRGTFDERIRSCTALTESDRLSDEDRAIAYHNRGLVRAAKGDNNRAIAALSVAIWLDPDSALAYLNRCKLRLAAGDRDGAITDCDAAIRLDSRLTEARYNRGL